MARSSDVSFFNAALRAMALLMLLEIARRESRGATSCRALLGERKVRQSCFMIVPWDPHSP